MLFLNRVVTWIGIDIIKFAAPGAALKHATLCHLKIYLSTVLIIIAEALKQSHRQPFNTFNDENGVMPTLLSVTHVLSRILFGLCAITCRPTRFILLKSNTPFHEAIRTIAVVSMTVFLFYCSVNINLKLVDNTVYCHWLVNKPLGTSRWQALLVSYCKDLDRVCLRICLAGEGWGGSQWRKKRGVTV